MIFITDPDYAEMASRLCAQWPERGNYFNGTIPYDTDGFYSTLTCSLILYRAEGAAGRVERAVPVWWDFSTCAGGEVAANDFSWNELVLFLT